MSYPFEKYTRKTEASLVGILILESMTRNLMYTIRKPGNITDYLPILWEVSLKSDHPSPN
jgi:hypothetical protein